VPWDIWLIFIVLGIVVPWRGRVRLRELLAKPHISSAERVSLYLTSLVFQWVIAAVVAWRAWAHRFSLAELGLASPGRWTIAGAAIIGTIVLATLHWLNLRRMGKPGAHVPDILRTLAARILPQSVRELVPFCALAVTAGICEEFIYRGFAMGAFARAGLHTWLVVLLSSFLFGLAHLYQGRGGILGTLLLGALFGIARIGYDSLVPVIFWHAAVDVVAGVFGRHYVVRNTVSTIESGS
jgi:uncharacterized protein